MGRNEGSEGSIEQDVLERLEQLRHEIELVYERVIKPLWEVESHHFPRTLYGYVMHSFAFIDLLSQYQTGRTGSRDQTKRMARFIRDYLGTDERAAAVTIQMWRHVLMHTGYPREVEDPSRGRRYRWLLHWWRELPRDQHMTLEELAPGEWKLNIALGYLVEDLLEGAKRFFQAAQQSQHLRQNLRRAADSLNRPYEFKEP